MTRCKPGQLATIHVQDTLVNRALGLTQLQGHVVRTLRLCQHPGLRPADGPCWEVDPPQRCQVVGPLPPGAAPHLHPGRWVELMAVPDAWLRPFNDFTPDELVERTAEVPA